MTEIERLVDDFERHLQVERSLSPHTVRNYLSDIKQLVEYLKSRTPPVALEALTYQDLRGYLAQRHTINKKVSVARKLAALRTFCKFLVRREVLSHNLAALAPTPKLENHLPKFLTIDEVFHLLEQTAGQTVLDLRDRAILELFYSGGLRVAEMVGLNLEDLDLTQHLARVRGKGGKERMVIVGTQAFQALRLYLQVRRELLTPDSPDSGRDSGFPQLPGRPPDNAQCRPDGGKMGLESRLGAAFVPPRAETYLCYPSVGG